MHCIQPGLRDLPESLLSHIMGLVALEQPEYLANAVLACKALRQAGEAVPHRARLTLTIAKLHQAREGGREQQLLAWLTRKAHLWREAVVVVHPLADLRLMLGSLAASGRSGLLRLELRSGVQEGRFRLPKELEQLTSLTELSIRCQALPASDLGRLSSLTALASVGWLQGALPRNAFHSLQQLTSVSLRLFNMSGELLGSQPIAACTALRRLLLMGRDPVPRMTEEQVLAAWQYLEELKLVWTPPRGNPRFEAAGFWHAVPQLPCLTSLHASDVAGVASQALSKSLPARLASLQLLHFSESALPPLPPTLTRLHLYQPTGHLDMLPVSPQLRDLELSAGFAGCPDSASAMLELTCLSLSGCPGGQLPSPLASLPALEVLQLDDSELHGFPQALACVGSLRQLDLAGNHLRSVPAVLGGGAASLLEHLDLGRNSSLVVGDDGLEVLESLAALTCLNLWETGQSIRRFYTESEVLR